MMDLLIMIDAMIHYNHYLHVLITMTYVKMYANMIYNGIFSPLNVFANGHVNSNDQQMHDYRIDMQMASLRYEYEYDLFEENQNEFSVSLVKLR